MATAVASASALPAADPRFEIDISNPLAGVNVAALVRGANELKSNTSSETRQAFGLFEKELAEARERDALANRNAATAGGTGPNYPPIAELKLIAELAGANPEALPVYLGVSDYDLLPGGGPRSDARQDTVSVVREFYKEANCGDKTGVDLQVLGLQLMFLIDPAQRAFLLPDILANFAAGVRAMRKSLMYVDTFERCVADLLAYYEKGNAGGSVEETEQQMETAKKSAEAALLGDGEGGAAAPGSSGAAPGGAGAAGSTPAGTAGAVSASAAASGRLMLKYLARVFMDDSTISSLKDLRKSAMKNVTPIVTPPAEVVVATIKQLLGETEDEEIDAGFWRWGATPEQRSQLRRTLDSAPLRDELVSLVRKRCTEERQCFAQRPPTSVLAVAADANLRRELPGDIGGALPSQRTRAPRVEVHFADSALDFVVDFLQAQHVVSRLVDLLGEYCNEVWRTYGVLDLLDDVIEEDPEQAAIFARAGFMEGWGSARDLPELSNADEEIQRRLKPLAAAAGAKNAGGGGGGGGSRRAGGRGVGDGRRGVCGPRHRRPAAKNVENCNTFYTKEGEKIAGFRTCLKEKRENGGKHVDAPRFDANFFAAARFRTAVDGVFAGVVETCDPWHDAWNLTIPHEAVVAIFDFFSCSEVCMRWLKRLLGRKIVTGEGAGSAGNGFSIGGAGGGDSGARAIARGMPSCSPLFRFLLAFAHLTADLLVNREFQGRVVHQRRLHRLAYWSSEPAAVAGALRIHAEARDAFGLRACEIGCLKINLRRETPAAVRDGFAELPDRPIQWGLFLLHPQELLVIDETVLRACGDTLARVVACMQDRRLPAMEQVRLWVAFANAVLMPLCKWPYRSTCPVQMHLIVEAHERVQDVVRAALGAAEPMAKLLTRGLQTPSAAAPEAAPAAAALSPEFLLWPVQLGGLNFRDDLSMWKWLRRQTDKRYPRSSPRTAKEVIRGLEVDRYMAPGSWSRCRWLCADASWTPEATQQAANRGIDAWWEQLTEVAAHTGTLLPVEERAAKRSGKGPSGAGGDGLAGAASAASLSREALLSRARSCPLYFKMHRNELWREVEQSACWAPSAIARRVGWTHLENTDHRYDSGLDNKSQLMAKTLADCLKNMFGSPQLFAVSAITFVREHMGPVKLAEKFCLSADRADMRRRLGLPAETNLIVGRA